MIKVIGEIRPDKKYGNKIFYFKKPKPSSNPLKLAGERKGGKADLPKRQNRKNRFTTFTKKARENA